MKHSKFYFIGIIGLLFELSFPSFLGAQSITGTWHGKLAIPNGTLTIVFHINRAEQGNYITTLDSPNQGATNMASTKTNTS